ncbi:hypothetical protein CVT91_09635 [Candidatus Atribacteria bacterium HGW-Atribacteria-1]|nr:MAG: hypothetical protein CVT91_09635 [Candidatus Atribacteria bacterium HGW-Atribacteria-1]
MRMVQAMIREKEKIKILTIVILLGISCFLTYYFHIVLKTAVIFTHFFYIPIILACIWWKRKGLLVAIFLAVLLIFSQIIFKDGVKNIDNYVRAFMFIVIAYVVATLSEKITKGHEETERQKNFSENIITTVPQSLLILDKDLRIKKANLTFYKVFQTRPEKAMGSNLCDLLPDKEGKLKNELTRIIGTEDILEDFEMLYQSEKLGERVFNIIAKGMIIEEEEVILIQDITDRKLAEEKLRRFSEELELEVEKRTKDLLKEKNYTRHLIESSTDFQLTIDDDGKIMDVNRAFEEFVGKSRGDIIGTLIYKYLPRKDMESFIKKIFEKKKVRNIELSIDVPGKEILHYNLSGTLFTSLDGELGVYISARDMTEVRRQHDELLAKEKQLAHTSRLSTLGEMASAMAHEINQPLSIISMVAEGIFRDIEKDRIDISLLPKDLKDILFSINRIDRIITHMRTFTRQPGEWKLIEPEQILNNAFIILSEQFRVHSILVSRHIEKNLPPIKTDPNQLEQVFINILINADQVLDEKKSQKEQLGESFQKQMVVNIFQEGEDVVFEFADNGYGVPDEIKSRIFEPFFTTKDPGEGTGLGLSIAYSILNQSLNGRIWVEDNKMRGASFKVALPIEKENQKYKNKKRG